MFRYLLFPIESLQLCLLLYFAVIISCRIILWFGSDTYFLHFSCWVPSALCLRLYLPRTSVVFTLFFDCDTILTSSCWVLSAVCLLLYLAVIVSCILWVCFGTYFFLLKPFSCVYFFTLPWSSATASFCDLDPILTLFLLSPFGFVFTSLLWREHQLYLRCSLIVFRHLLLPVESFQLYVYFFTLLVIVSCACFILWLRYDTYFFHFCFLDPFYFVFTSLLCFDHQLHSRRSLIVYRHLLLPVASCQLCVYFFTLQWSSVAFASFSDCDTILTSFTFTSWIPPVVFRSLLCFDHQLHSRRSLIVYRHLLLLVASFQLCVYFFTLQWSSVAFASFSDCDTILTSFTFTSWIPPVVFRSLLCFDHQLHSLIVFWYLLLPIESLQLCLLLYFAVIVSDRFILWFGSDTYFLHFSCWVPSALCLLLCFALIVSYVCFILWLWYDTYFFPFYFLDPFSQALLHSLLISFFDFFLLNPFSCAFFFNLPWTSVTASFLWFGSDTYFFHFFLLRPFMYA